MYNSLSSLTFVHSFIDSKFGGNREPLSICCLAAAQTQPVSLFDYLKPDCKPITVKSKQHSDSDLKSGNGLSAQYWLLFPGPVLLERHNRDSRYEPFVEEVTLQGYVGYVHIQLPDGTETAVSIRHLAPVGDYGESIHQRDLKERVFENRRPENQAHQQRKVVVNEGDQMSRMDKNDCEIS
ncbi:hypothetical protein PR048_021886 [Dryococelus australis]|uniref:Uncharacterized protein n=1 Tax=Dryococelus australis TaxID=614101 RepID=A0ABQ9GZK4_9NEOP|nr:hypothetical protein PR048_021886 [Dryococelus australis]